MKLKRIRPGLYRIGDTDWYIGRFDDGGGGEVMKSEYDGYDCEPYWFDKLSDAKEYFLTRIMGRKND